MNDRVFRIRTYYQPSMMRIRDRWNLKTKQLFDDIRDYEKALRLAKKQLNRRKNGLSDFKVVADEFVNGTWEELETTTTKE